MWAAQALRSTLLKSQHGQVQCLVCRLFCAGHFATNSYLISGLTDGQYRFRVKAHDADGNISSFSIASPNL